VGCIVYAVSRTKDLLQEWTPHVVITDTIGMPYSAENAVALVSGLRECFDTGVVVLSGSAELLTDAGSLDADAIVIKPFEIESFVATVLKVAARRAPSYAG
jgi:DNA-binding NarL/FixJ family response regulator